ncbi:HET-s/LopB domain protein [Trematosphaeria pertusa]|uniref:HET-s/LopB domain protein n=1 Tax=Trematosphaeria pertusa TaxID=390896 RepID=A0A6A6I6E0_9PLEO|nr:HET-s/LopB domain protein [Trematosphaeria pertusa]KAF2245897.1 HET-s/LopB domain protein [Trematosphaeria pertusa]
MEVALGIAGLALAAPTVVKTCFNLVDALMQKVEKNKSLRSHAERLKAFEIKTGRSKLKQDMKLGEAILKDPTVEQNDKACLEAVFDDAMKTLKEMDVTVDTILQNCDNFLSRKRRVALAKFTEQSRALDTTTNRFHDIVISQTLVQISESNNNVSLLKDFDFTIIGPLEDWKPLNKSAFIHKGRLTRSLKDIPAGTGEFVIESRAYKAATRDWVKTNLRFLAQRLAAAQLAEGILPLVGCREDSVRQEFQLAFCANSYAASAQTLQLLYCEKKTLPTLNFRLGLCANLAEAILHVHTLGLVHKNIRPENVLIASNDNCESNKVFLLGWKYARKAFDAPTVREGEPSTERKIYQHPHRQVEIADEDYCMGHDIYSLGVCMLEILAWAPLISSTEAGETSFNEDFKSGFKNRGLAKDKDEVNPAWLKGQHPRNVQRVLQDMAADKLPYLAGTRMAEVVASCLGCLESEEGRGGDANFRGRNPKEVGADFVDSVLKHTRSVAGAI